MNILFLSQRIPYPPNRGDKIRSFHIIEHLSKNHSISVACLAQSEKELGYAEELNQQCDSVDVALLNPFRSKLKSLFSILGRKPLTLSYFHSKRLQKTVDELVANRDFDLVFVYSSSMAQYVLELDNVRKILDFVDVDSDKWLQYSQHKRFPMSTIYRMEGNRLRAYEATIAEQFDRCLVVSEPERELMKSYAPQADITAISNGVNFEYFKPENSEYEPYTLIFTGVMDYYANVDGVLYFCEKILPLIKSEIPQVKFYIVGSSPVEEIRQLAQRESIVVTGFVEDIRTYLRKAAVSVVPLRIARGIQNKILEAMSIGVPVVTTSQAFEGINAEPGKHLFLEDTPQQFATRVIELLNNPELRMEIAQSGRRLILEKYNWDICLAELDKIIEKICPDYAD